MSYIPYQTSSFLKPFDDIYHLHVIMNDPCNEGECLIINVTSVNPKRYYDSSCVLEKGDHEFIKHQSYLLYRRAETERAKRLENMIGKNFFIRKENFSKSVFQKIVDGLSITEECPQRILNYASKIGIL